MSGRGGKSVSYTHLFFYNYNGKIYGYISETGTAEKVVDWMECDVDSNNMQAYKILPDGRVFAFTQKWTQDGTQTPVSYTHLAASSRPQSRRRAWRR